LILSISVVGVVALTTDEFQKASPMQAETTSFEVLPSPQLEDDIELHYHGSGAEFEASHVATGGLSSYVNLTWTHIAGTELNMTAGALGGELPYYWDFCYFSTSFTWTYDEMPMDAMFYITYSIHSRGDFNTTDGVSMFKVYSWLIDSSDDWTCMYESEPPYSTNGHLYSYDLNYFDLQPGWAGMVQDAYGAQEDPTDVLKVAVGLAMSEDFGDLHDGSYPWEAYNGSVSAIISSISLIVTMESTPDIPISQLYYAGGLLTIAIVAIGIVLWKVSSKGT